VFLDPLSELTLNQHWSPHHSSLFIIQHRKLDNILPGERLDGWLLGNTLLLLLLVGRYWVPRYLFKSLGIY
jgi:hypothetical protein